MDDIILIVLLISVVFVLVVFSFYIIKTYFFPKQLNELETMIKQGHLQPAIKRLQKMIEENSRDPYIHFLLARAYEQSKDHLAALMEYKQAIKYLELEVVDKRLKEHTVRKRLGKLYLFLKNNEEAKKEFLILTKIEPDNADNFYQVGLIFEKSGLLNKALPYFQNAVKIDSNHSDAQYHTGFIQFFLGNIKDAKSALTEAIRANDQNYDAHYYLGMCHRTAKDYDTALKELSIAMRDESLRGKGHLGKGLCYWEQQDIGKAQTEFTYALESSERNSDMELNARYHLSLVAERNRDFNSAISHWERIMDINPKYQDVRQKLKMYEDFRTDDNVKDFLIASSGKFQNICNKIAEHINLTVENIRLESDSEAHMLCNSNDVQVRGNKKNSAVLFVFRSADPIVEKSIRQLYDNMNSLGSTRGICISTSEFTSQAEKFAQSRPIELISNKETTKILRAVI